MGLKITQPIGTINQGSLQEFYVRIENLSLNRRSGNLFATVAAYATPDDAKLSFPVYYEDLQGNTNTGSQFKPQASYVIATEIIYKGEVVGYPVIVQSVIDEQTNFDNLYGHAYYLVKKRYSEMFGEDNIIDEA